MVAIQNAHPRQPRSIYFGEEIQTDACIHLWFGNTKTALHAAIDDATGYVLAAFFDNQETLNGYYNIYYQILTKFGIPYLFKTVNVLFLNTREKVLPLTKTIPLLNLLMPAPN